MDEGADTVWLPLKYLEKSQKVWRFFKFYGGIVRALKWNCESVDVWVHISTAAKDSLCL